MTLPTYTAIFGALREAYRLNSRDSQLKLSEFVRAAVTTGGVLCAEAPTGTGKTIGYLAGALDAQAHLPETKRVPIVVATATVSLQEQIVREDIPRLAAVGAVSLSKVAVAKGRNRYFCPRTTALLEDKRMRDSQFDIFDAEKHVANGGTAIALDMLRDWREGRWDGDRDSWRGVIPDCWESSCGASSDTCVNRACEYYDRCPYMASRQRLATAQLIVANHDIVLADLKQRSEEQSSTVLPPKRYALIVDEAHNLPEKAISTKRARANLNSTDWLRKLSIYEETNMAVPRIAKVIKRGEGFSSDIFSVGATELVHSMEALSKELSSMEFDLGGTHHLGLGDLSEDLKGKVLLLAAKACMLLSGFQAVGKAYAEFADEAVGADKAFAIRQLAATHTYTRQASEIADGFEMFADKEVMVRWIQRNKHGEISLNSQPMEGKDVLDKLLWPIENMPKVLVSATIQIAGSFERFRDKSGLPHSAVTEILPAVFDYSRGFLHLPKMDTAPEDAGYELELVEKIPKLYNNKISNGMLILFTAREQLRRVVERLPDDMLSNALIQLHRPVPELVALHKERIDRGERSVLMGLDSMAEGLDLPGKYCGHVVITRLPFGVPGDPVESARRDHMGKDWFEKAYLADMLITLTQGAGRLIRRETDHGVITVLDKRLHTKRYGKTAIEALPNFTRGPKLSGYLKMAKEREFDMSYGAKPVVATKPAAKLALVTAEAPAPAVATEPVAAPPAPVDPLHELNGILSVKGLVPTSNGIPCSIDTLETALEACMPHQKGPFGQDQAYLGHEGSAPCLPAGIASDYWVERAMPQAVYLGLKLRNSGWDTTAPAWAQVLCLRPDLLQFAQILRSQVRELLDERNALVSEDICREQLLKGFAGLGLPSEELLFEHMDNLDAEVAEILSNAHVPPSKDLLLALPAAARELAKQLRSKKR